LQLQNGNTESAATLLQTALELPLNEKLKAELTEKLQKTVGL
jgi:hypothetical protein